MNKIKENRRVRILKAMAHEERFRILEFLSNNPRCFCEFDKLYKNSEYSQSNISQHLKILKDADLIISERKGNNMHYSLADEKIIELVKIINELV